MPRVLAAFIGSLHTVAACPAFQVHCIRERTSTVSHNYPRHLLQGTVLFVALRLQFQSRGSLWALRCMHQLALTMGPCSCRCSPLLWRMTLMRASSGTVTASLKRLQPPLATQTPASVPQTLMGPHSRIALVGASPSGWSVLSPFIAL